MAVNGMAEVSASPLTPALVQTTTIQANLNTELQRFMPVMDITQAVQRRQAIVQATQQLMQEGVDYGKIPGAGDKPTLLQPGADKLCNLFGLVVRYEIADRIEDWDGKDHGGEPFFYYFVVSRAYRGDFLLGEGIGSCNSWEAKYRWRKAERSCPVCGKENIRKSKDAGWYCWKKTDGCGAVFPDGDARIESQPTGRKPNSDVFDSVNTVQKMALKRAKISATINATSSAEFFTQDIEEMDMPDLRDIQRDASKLDTGGKPMGTQGAADYVAQQKIAALQQQRQETPPRPWTSRGEMKMRFASVREQVGERVYLITLEKFGVKEPGDFRKYEDGVKCYDMLVEIARKEVA